MTKVLVRWMLAACVVAGLTACGIKGGLEPPQGEPNEEEQDVITSY